MPHEQSKGLEGQEVDDEDDNNASISASSAPMQADSRKKRPFLQRGRVSSSANSCSKGSNSLYSQPLGFVLRRAFRIGRRGGPSTPVPSWKVSDNSILDSSFAHHHHHSRQQHHSQYGQGHFTSARRLAASLWELQELPFSNARRSCVQVNKQQKSQSMHQDTNLTEQGSVSGGEHISQEMSPIRKGSHERCPPRTKSGDSGRVRAEPEDFQEFQITMERKGYTPKSLVFRSKDILSNLTCGPMTTNDLLKLLTHVWNLEQQHAATMALIGMLRTELDEAQSQLQDLLLFKRKFSNKIESISTRIAEERALWQKKQEQYIKEAVKTVKQELEIEKKSKQKLEGLHKKAAKEFQVARKRLVRALEDLKREQKARKLMEEVCDELAREIGQDKARVEELKQESAKVKEEVEEERKMLQMAEIWREERVQMKLMEAKLELEEKNAAVDKLRSQLEVFLKRRKAVDTRNDVVSDTMLDLGRHATNIVIGRNLSDPFHTKEQHGVQSGRYSVDSSSDQQVRQSARLSGSYDDNDDDDDLHSIELNHEPLVRMESGNLRPQSFQPCEKETIERELSDESISAGHDCEPLLRRFQIIETLEIPRIDQQMDISGSEEAKSGNSVQASLSRSCQVLDHTTEGEETTEQRQGEEGDLQQCNRKSTRSLSSDFEDSQSHNSSSSGVVRSTMCCSRSPLTMTKDIPQLPHDYGDWQQVSSPSTKWNHHFLS